MNKDEYTYRIDHIADEITKDFRIEINRRIMDVVKKNQDTFLAHWLLQNPDADLSKVRLYHGFKGNYYQFWIEEHESLPVQAPKYPNVWED